MFERYTDRAKRAVELAHLAAQGLGHDEVGTDHLLLGLLGEGDGVAFRALGALGVTTEAANEAVCRRHPAEDPVDTGWLPYTPRFKKAAELALREALQLGCNYVGTEHLLLGLIREGSDVGALALADCGIAEGDRGFLDDVRAKVLELLHGYREAEKRAAVPVGTQAPGPLSEHVSVRFPAALMAAAKQAAASEGVDVSAWIRREVDREIDRRAGRCHACGQAVPQAQA